MTKAEALKQFAGQPFKVELIEGIADEKVSLYKQGAFLDLCEGPHVDRTTQVPPFKLTSVAGAYWRGDEKRPMLQRIYGAMFETQAELDDYLARMEEAAQPRPPQARPRARALHDERPRRLGPAVAAAEGRDDPPAARGVHAQAGARRRLPARLHAGSRQGRAVQDLRALGALPRQHVPADAARARGAGADADELPAPHPHLPERAAQLPRTADPHRRDSARCTATRSRASSAG